MGNLTKLAEKLIDVCRTKEEFIEILKLFQEAFEINYHNISEEIKFKLSELEEDIKMDNIKEWAKVWDIKKEGVDNEGNKS